MSVASNSSQADSAAPDTDQSAASFSPLDQMDTDASADSATRQTKRQKVEDDQWTALGSVDHDGHTYHVGDHVILDDTDNSSGARGTDLPAIGHVQGIQRSQQGTVLVTVAWYVHPRLTPHPPYMEFYQDAILRTFRQSQVPVERIQKACFVVQPTEYMSGRPGEWKEGDRIFVCDSRFVDRGQFIQKIKHWNKGFWPEHMDPGRKEMLTNMVPWSEGPRTLEKSVLEARPTEGSDGSMPQRRVTRMAATPTKVTTAENPGTPAVSASVPHGASPATAQAQLLAFQQMMSQGRMDMPTGGNANGQNQQQMLLLMQQQAQAHVDLGAAAADTRASQPSFAIGSPQQQQQQQQQKMLQIMQQQQAQQQSASGLSPLMSRAPMSPGSAAASAITPLPRRRGRPPKNKQLIEKRAMEDAAAAVAAAAGTSMGNRTPTKTATTPTRRQTAASPYNNVGRPPVPIGISGANGSDMMRSQRLQQPTTTPTYTPAQLLGSRNQAGMAATQILQQQQLQLLHQQQQQMLQQQQQQAAKTSELPHIDPTTVPQLSKEIVSLFPKAGDKIKWFATAPICHSTNTAAIRHSQAYLQWLNKNPKLNQ